MTANEETVGTGSLLHGHGIAIEPREDQDIREYVRALEERVMKLEAQHVRTEAQGVKVNLLRDGYDRFAGYDADAAACAKAECESCGHVGMQYEAYRGMLPKSYRAFAVCSACGFRTEF